MVIKLNLDSKFQALARSNFIQLFLSSLRRRGYEIVRIVGGKEFVFRKVA